MKFVNKMLGEILQFDKEEKMNRIISLLGIVVILGFVFLLQDYQLSFKTINEALYSKENSAKFQQIKQIIGGSEYGNKAFYFFLNNDNEVVGATFKKGAFGWKNYLYVSGTGLEIDKKQKLSMAINNSTEETNKFYFGLTSYENISNITVNKTNYATLIHLDEIILDDINLQNTYLWYVNLKDNSNSYSVDIYDNENKLTYSKINNF